MAKVNIPSAHDVRVIVQGDVSGEGGMVIVVVDGVTVCEVHKTEMIDMTLPATDGMQGNEGHFPAMPSVES